MKGLMGIAVGILAFTPLGFAQSSLPNCANTCLASALRNSICSPTDQACVCTDASLNAQVSVCVQSSCTVKEQLTTMNLTSIACSVPVRNKSETYRNLRIVFYTLSTASIAVRFISRYKMGISTWYDDWTVALVLVCMPLLPQVYETNCLWFMNTALEVFGLAGLVKHGLGQDIWKVPFDSISKILFFFWIGEPIYFVEVSLIKIAFLFFYLRIFPDHIFRRILWILIFVNALTGAIFAVAVCLVCRPVSFVWNQWDGEHVGHCGDLNALAFANAGVSIFLDVVTLALPITQIWNLHLTLKKKIGVMLMFSVGGFVTIVSILRLKSLVTFANTKNPTWEYFDAGVWSTIELDVGIICVCMPSLRHMLIRMFPSLGSTHDSTDKRTTTDKHSGSRTQIGKALKINDVKTGISCSRNYGVEYTMKPAQDESSFVHLVEIAVVREAH